MYAHTRHTSPFVSAVPPLVRTLSTSPIRPGHQEDLAIAASDLDVKRLKVLWLGMLNGCIILRSWDAGRKLSGSIIGLVRDCPDTKGVLRSSGEVLFVDGLRSGLLGSWADASLGTADVILGLLGDVAGVGLERLGGICGVLRRKILHLSSLGVDNLTGMAQLLVNELLV